MPLEGAVVRQDDGGVFLFAAGTASGRLASYRVDGDTGALTPPDIYGPTAAGPGVAVPLSR